MSLAGGVTFSGRNPYDTNTLNGAFGMEFSQPPYRLSSRSPIKNVDLKFKKSVVFHDDFLVCVGSQITTSGVTNGAQTRTTLFQDKLTSKFSQSPSDSKVFKCGSGNSKSSSSWGNVANVVLEDTNGNR